MLIAAWLGLGLLLGTAYLVLIGRHDLQTKRKLFAIGLVVAALIYMGFAIIWGDARWLLIETLGVGIYGLFAWLGWRHSCLWLAAGWGAHPFWDVPLHLVASDVAIAPTWYVVACLPFDLLVAAAIVKNHRTLNATQLSEQ